MDSILALAYLSSENQMFWLSREGREIHSCSINLNCSNHFKVFKLFYKYAAYTELYILGLPA